MEFYHSHIVISNFPSAFSHHHFIILFYLPHFIIRILSSLFFHPPSAAIRSAFNRDPLTGVFSLSQEINFWCIYHQLTLWYVDFPRTQMNNIPEKKSCYALIEPMLGTYLLLTSFSRSVLWVTDRVFSARIYGPRASRLGHKSVRKKTSPMGVCIGGGLTLLFFCLFGVLCLLPLESIQEILENSAKSIYLLDMTPIGEPFNESHSAVHHLKQWLLSVFLFPFEKF